MKRVITYIIWPIIAGILFAGALLTVPYLIKAYPGLFPGISAIAPTAAGGAPGMLSFSEAIRQAAPAVVSINHTQQVLRRYELYNRNDPRLRAYLDRFEEDNTLGSGVIISPSGYIITSFHIFSSGIPDKTLITLADGRTLEARLVAVDEKNDLVLLKVDAEALPYIQTGPSRNLEVGELVLAIGNPRNIGQSVSLGIISALLNRGDDFVIQTDAAINPGNSGGALIDIHGNLIGINSTIVSESGGSEGIGFATPADQAFKLMSNYIESGPSGYLGVNSQFGSIEVQGQLLHGFRVDDVVANGPADKAGIEPGDIITGVDDTPVDAAGGKDFIQTISSHKPGESVTIEVFRKGEFLQLKAILAVGEPSVTRDFKQIIPDSDRGSVENNVPNTDTGIIGGAPQVLN